MQKVHSFSRSSLTIGTCAALMFALSGCESAGGLRVGGIGTPGSGSTADSGGGSGSGGGGTTADAGGSGSAGGGAGAGAGAGAGGSAGGGTQAGGSTGGTGSGTKQAVAGPALVTAGNAVLGVSNGQGGVLTPVATALPVAQPVTGTITKVLNDTGTVLVDAGQGRTLLVEGARGVAGDVLTINVGDRAVTSPLGGGQGAIGAGVLGNTQPGGTIASAGVLNAGNSVLADVNGVAGVRVSNVTASTGGISGDLVNAALGGNQSLGGANNPALINANLLPNGVPAVGQPGVSGLTTPVTQAVGNVASNVTGNSGVGATVNGAANGTVAGTPVLGTGAGANAGANAGVTNSAANGGLLGPVATTVNGAVNGTGALAPVGATVNGAVNGAANTVLPTRP